MAIADLEQAASVQSATGCSACQTRDAEIARLTAELDYCRRGWRQARWIGVVAGLLLLAVVPPGVGGGIMLLAEGFSFNGEDTTHALLGAIAGSFIVPWIILSVCATLNWRPAWQRWLLFVPAFCWLAGVETLLGTLLSVEDAIGLPIAMAPFLVLTAAMPALGFRMWRRWTIVPRDIATRPRATSIATLLIVTGLWSAVAACARWLDVSQVTASPGPIGVVAVVFLYAVIPAFVLGTVVVVCLRVAMIRGNLAALAGFAATAMVSLPILCGMVLLLTLPTRVNDQPIGADELPAVVLMALGVGVTTLFISIISFLWLRLLGYRIETR